MIYCNAESMLLSIGLPDNNSDEILEPEEGIKHFLKTMKSSSFRCMGGYVYGIAILLYKKLCNDTFLLIRIWHSCESL